MGFNSGVKGLMTGTPTILAMAGNLYFVYAIFDKETLIHISRRLGHFPAYFECTLT